MAENEEGANEQEIEVVLEAEAEEAVRKAVLESNPDKLEDELADAIAAAKQAKLDELKAESKPLLDKVAELRKDTANKDKTPEELMTMATEAIAAEPLGEPSLGDDYFNNIDKASEKAAEQVDTTDLPEDIKAQVAELNRLKNDPIFAAYLEVNKNGGDFLSMIRQSGVMTDISKAPAEDLYRIDLERLKDVDPTITEESISEAIEEFKDLSPIEKAKLVAPVRERLLKQQEEARKVFGTKAVADTKAAQIANSKLMDDLGKTIQTFKGQTFLGVTLDEKKLNDAYAKARNGALNFRKADGSPDLDAAAKTLLLLENARDIANEAYKKGVKEGRKAVERKVHNPSLGIRFGGTPASNAISPNAEYALNAAKAKKEGLTMQQYVAKYGK